MSQKRREAMCPRIQQRGESLQDLGWTERGKRNKEKCEEEALVLGLEEDSDRWKETVRWSL